MFYLRHPNVLYSMTWLVVVMFPNVQQVIQYLSNEHILWVWIEFIIDTSVPQKVHALFHYWIWVIA